MIMKHPELIETIASLARSEGETPPTEQAAPSTVEREEQPTPTNGIPLSKEPPREYTASKGENRKRLFSAIRPFLSEERARTLSGVEAMVSILDSLHS